MNHGIAFLSLLFTCGAAAQSQFVDTPSARAEFVGLRSMAAQELYDKLVEHDKPKPPHLCAATLKELGLADAAVTWVPREGEKGFNILVIAVEDPARVRYRPEPAGESRELPPNWRPLVAAVKNPGEFQFALLNYGRILAQPERPYTEHIDVIRKASGGELPVPERALIDGWDALRAVVLEGDLEEALWAAANDSDPMHRAAAACCLLNFSGDDRAWHALVDAQRDSHGAVSSLADQGLITLYKHRPRRVDWSAATGSISAILEGTNPFALRHLLSVLLATEIDPALAPRLIPMGGALLLDVARSSDPGFRDAALGLLRHLSRRPGAGVDELEAWAKGLVRGS